MKKLTGLSPLGLGLRSALLGARGGGTRLCARGGGFLLLVLLAEALHAARRVHQLVLAGEEGVARRADFRAERAARGTGFDDVAARAGDAGRWVDGMNLGLHVLLLFALPGNGPPKGPEVRRSRDRGL